MKAESLGASLRATRAIKFISLLVLAYAAAGCKERSAKSHARSTSSQQTASSGEAADRGDVHGSIVVLGSSTAAGIGPKDPNNAWVTRYRAYLSARFPRVTLVNLAAGGQTTFEVQPSGYVPPANRPAPVEGRNITAALTLNPSAIVVNLPSNDQANNYPLAEQLANYDRIARVAHSAHVPLWVSTSQPRNFDESTQIEDLIRARDAIAKKFAPRVLDFWTPFASRDGFIKASYNAGDGTHLNDEAHAILAAIVEAARIPENFARSAD